MSNEMKQNDVHIPKGKVSNTIHRIFLPSPNTNKRGCPKRRLSRARGSMLPVPYLALKTRAFFYYIFYIHLCYCMNMNKCRCPKRRLSCARGSMLPVPLPIDGMPGALRYEDTFVRNFDSVF